MAGRFERAEVGNLITRSISCETCEGTVARLVKRLAVESEDAVTVIEVASRQYLAPGEQPPRASQADPRTGVQVGHFTIG